jgi:hypothetical protein
VITPDKVVLFVENKQLDESVKKYLGQDVELKPYGSFYEYLKSLSSSLNLGADYVRSLPFSNLSNVDQQVFLFRKSKSVTTPALPSLTHSARGLTRLYDRSSPTSRQ